MLDRKLLTEALRIDNEDVLPKFGKQSIKKLMEDSMEFLSIESIMDPETHKVSEEGMFDIMTILTDKCSVGVNDMDGQPALSFICTKDGILAHNLYTDEDSEMDFTKEAISEYIEDQLEGSEVDEAEEPEADNITNVIFKKEPDDNGDFDILAVFPDDIDYVGDQSKVLVYSHVGQHGYASEEYIADLEDASPEEYEELAEELRAQGYNLNILNGLADDANAPSTDMIDPYEGTYHEESPLEVPAGYALDEVSDKFKSAKEADKAIAQAKRKLQSKLDKGDFYENFGQEELRSIRDRVPSYAEDMDQDEFNRIQKMVSEFGEWCSTATPKHEAENGLNNYAIIKCKDIGNATEILDIIEGFSSASDALQALEEMQNDPEFEDPTLSLFVAYSDGVSWFDANTGEELDYEENEIADEEAVNEDYSIDSALDHLDEEIKSAKAVLDKIQQRVVYRMKDNVSYTGKEAIDKVLQVADKISQDSSALHELVYNDIIG